MEPRIDPAALQAWAGRFSEAEFARQFRGLLQLAAAT
jgi:hypothetical protein